MLYLHIGLHKTGTTFLQNEVFPKWKGIVYLKEDKLEYLTRMKAEKTYLLSREGISGKNWMPAAERDKCIENLANMLPDAKILLSFRNHADFIPSSYAQYLQQGGYLKFEEYFDIYNDNGYMKKADFIFTRKINTVQRCFGHSPFVMLFEDIVNDRERLFKRLQEYMGGTPPDSESISNKQRNKSVNYYSAKLLRYLNSKSKTEFNTAGKYDLYNWRFKRLGVDPRSICQYKLGFLPNKPFISENTKSAIADFYSDDWEKISAYTRA